MVDQARINTAFTGDISDLKAKIEQAQNQGEGFKASFGQIGAAIAGAFSARAIINFGIEALNVAYNIDNLSKRMRVGVETTQSMGVVMKEAGLGADTFAALVNRLTKIQTDAASGNKAAAASFAALGISIGDVQSMNPEQMFERVAKALKENEGSAKATSAAYEIFGKSAGESLEVIKSVGAEGFDALNKRMRESNQILSEDTIKNLDNAGDALERVKTAAKNFGISLLGGWAKFSEHLGTISVQTSYTAEQMELINRSLDKKEAKMRAAAEAATEAARIAEEQAEIEKAMAEYAAAKEVTKKVELHLEQQVLEKKRELEAMQARLSESYDLQNITTVERIRLETEIVKASRELEGLEERRAKEILAEQVKQKEALLALEKQYGDAVKELNDYLAKQWWEGLSAQEKAAELRERQKADLDMLKALQDDELGNRIEIAKLMLTIEKRAREINAIEKSIADAAGDSADGMKDASDNTRNMEKAAEAVEKKLSEINAFEMERLVQNMKRLQQALKDIAGAGGFPDIKLPDLSNFNIPEWMTKGNSAMVVQNIVKALTSLAQSLANPNVDFGAIGKALDFKLPDMTNVDPDGLVKILKATKDAKFGSLEIKIDYPEKGIPLDVSNLRMDELVDGVNTLAGLKGVAFY